MKTGITLEVRGGKYDVDLNEDNGTFSTEVNREFVRAPSIEALREKVMKATRATTLDIRFCRPGNDTVRYGTVTGVHASKRAVLVKWNDGHRETIQSYQLSEFLEPLSNEDAREYAKLANAARATADNLKQFRVQHRLDVWDLARKAQAEATGGNA